jgi:FkbM family methyltransferase
MKETDTVDWISRMAKIHPNATLVDVGANIGIYSILWLRVSNGKVICVEPLPSNVLSLINNMKKNKMVNRSQVVQAVATSETKIVDFYSPSIMPGEGFGSALVPRNYPADNYNFLVMGVPISSLHFASEELIVKVDVEGSELEVVRGLELFFQAGRIRSVIFEKNDGSKQVLEYLATHNLIEETGTGIGNIICNLVG